MNYKSYATFAARLVANRAATTAKATASAATAAVLAYNMVRKAENEAFRLREAERADSPLAGQPRRHSATA